MIEKCLFVTGDILKPRESFAFYPEFEQHQRRVTELQNTIKTLNIEAHLLWESRATTLEAWIEREHLVDVLDLYTEISPQLLQSATCVVGWELPIGLQNALEAKGIPWVSFAPYIWSPRRDILHVTSNNASLLQAIHQPLPQTQPIWSPDHLLRERSALIIDPPRYHRARLRRGKIHSLNDHSEEIIGLLESASDVLLFPSRVLYDIGAFFSAFIGVRPLNGPFSSIDVYLASSRVSTVASLDPSISPLAEMFQKKFHLWNDSSQPFAFIPLRNTKSRHFWDTILTYAGH